MNLQINNEALHAFYDLAESPVTYDFITFLVLANCAREHLNLKSIQLYIAPGPNEGFRFKTDRDKLQPATTKNWHLTNVVINSVQMLPSVSSITKFETESDAYTRWQMIRAAAPQNIFPGDYNFESNRVNAYFVRETVKWHNVGANVQSLSAPQVAVDYCHEWLKNRIGNRIPISITLRENKFQSPRNTDFNAWSGFIKQLDLSIYEPIIIRDSFISADPMPEEFTPYLCFDAALFNIAIRGAMYESCKLNLFVSNGCAHLAYFNNKVNFLTYNILHEEIFTCSSRFLKGCFGIEVGKQFPYFSNTQRFIWEKDTTDVLVSTFNQTMSQIVD